MQSAELWQGLFKLRVLLCFLKLPGEDCTVTGIARTLNREKYAVSRALSALEREGCIHRPDGRKPALTPLGLERAQYYEERLQISINHLLYEGVDMECARQDALLWARYCTAQTMETIRASENWYRVKYALRGKKQLRGDGVCRLLRDGSYQVPFVIYREQTQGGSNISLANEGFVHPCVLRVDGGVGTVHLRAVPVVHRMPEEGQLREGKITTLRYFRMGRYIAAESSGDVFSFPAQELQFLNYGSGMGQILHGSLCLELGWTAGPAGEEKGIFTLFL